ncbi:Sec-independent protein translocase protein TatA (modular protein) [Flavobacterium psychrophilum]|nr:Sec-independent protein translocase protein TatA (modular protein) [Flavobacterium psychrophilum]
MLKVLFLNCASIILSIMGRLGVTEILMILAVVLLLFGGKKIPELMKGLGSGIKEFKNAAKDEQPADSKKEDTKE